MYNNLLSFPFTKVPNGICMTVHYGNTVPCPKDKRAEARENGQSGKIDR